MRVVNVAQSSPEWLEFRRQGIGSSDAPVIEGNSPYRTPLQLFQEKRGQSVEAEEDDSKEFIFAKGHKTEILIRTQFAELTGVEMNPLCLIHPKLDHVRASLDGFDPNKYGVLEAKLIGREVLERARSAKRMKISERIPAHHYTQIQHELACADVDLAHWFGHDGSKSGVLLEIRRDKKYIAQLLEKENRFWEAVQKGETPALSEMDYLVPDDLSLLTELREAKELMENAALNYEALKERVTSLYNHPRIAGGGIKLIRATRAGSLNLMTVPEIKAAVEKAGKKLKPEYLEQYRGKGSSYWTIRIDAPKKAVK